VQLLVANIGGIYGNNAILKCIETQDIIVIMPRSWVVEAA
jgi:hypothetical protein